jgi:16S rRNA (guanine1207-N2)-methyltransferase
LRYADLLLAKEQTGSAVPADEPARCCRWGDIFVVGENRSGVRSAEQMLAEYAPLNKVDSARRCGLYHGRLEKQPTFDADAFWGEYTLDNLTIKTLPGVFSRDGLDVGSQLLLST